MVRFDVIQIEGMLSHFIFGIKNSSSFPPIRNRIFQFHNKVQQVLFMGQARSWVIDIQPIPVKCQFLNYCKSEKSINMCAEESVLSIYRCFKTNMNTFKVLLEYRQVGILFFFPKSSCFLNILKKCHWKILSRPKQVLKIFNLLSIFNLQWAYSQFQYTVDSY